MKTVMGNVRRGDARFRAWDWTSGEEVEVPLDPRLNPQANLQRFFDLGTRPGPQETRRLMAPFAPHRSLATFHLWALQEELQ